MINTSMLSVVFKSPINQSSKFFKKNDKMSILSYCHFEWHHEIWFEM